MTAPAYNRKARLLDSMRRAPGVWLTFAELAKQHHLTAATVSDWLRDFQAKGKVQSRPRRNAGTRRAPLEWTYGKPVIVGIESAPFKPLTRALHGPACGIGRPWHPGSVSGEGWLR